MEEGGYLVIAFSLSLLLPTPFSRGYRYRAYTCIPYILYTRPNLSFPPNPALSQGAKMNMPQRVPPLSYPPFPTRKVRKKLFHSHPRGRGGDDDKKRRKRISRAGGAQKGGKLFSISPSPLLFSNAAGKERKGGKISSTLYFPLRPVYFWEAEGL